MTIDGAKLRSGLAGLLPPRRVAPATRIDPDAIGDKGEKIEERHAPTLRLLNDEATRRLDGQRQAASQLDTKAAAIVTLSLTGAGLVITTDRTGVAVWIAVVGFAISFLLGVTALSVRSWRDAPNPEVGPSFEHSPEWEVLDRLVRAKAKAFALNCESMEAKSEWLKITTGWLVVPVAAAFASFF